MSTPLTSAFALTRVMIASVLPAEARLGLEPALKQDHDWIREVRMVSS